MTSYGEQRCQECNHPVAPELEEKMAAGKNVYCEQCGASLTEATVIKTKLRRNVTRQSPGQIRKKSPFSGGKVRSKRNMETKDNIPHENSEQNFENQEFKGDPAWSKDSTKTKSVGYTSPWTQWIKSFKEFLHKFFKNLRESMSGFSTSLQDEVSKVKEEFQGKPKKMGSSAYPEPIMPIKSEKKGFSKEPIPAPRAPQSPTSPGKKHHLKPSAGARFDPYTGKPLFQGNNTKIGKKFDPFTGKSLVSNKKIVEDAKIAPSTQEIKTISDKNVSSLNKVIKLSPKDEIISIKQKTGKTYDEVFTVLSSEVREMIENLEIPDTQKASIVKTFIYLSDDQQIKYLDELQSLNSPDYSQLNHLIGTIDELPLPPEQKKILIDQLDYFTDEKSIEFVSVIQGEVRKDIERLKKSQKSGEIRLEVAPEETKVKPPQPKEEPKKLLSD